MPGGAIDFRTGEGRRQSGMRNFCTVLHIFPQGFGENPLAKFSECSYYAHRLIGKKNFTSQFREGSEGKTEPVPIELN
jgi:hypothetical protein